MAKERLEEESNTKLTQFLEAGYPDGEVVTNWQTEESLRELYAYRDSTLSRDYLEAHL